MYRYFAVLLTIVFAVPSLAQEKRGFQLWNKNEVDIQPWEKVTLEIGEKIHYNLNRNTIDLKFAELLVEHEPVKWISYGGGFRISQVNLYSVGWSNENRTMAFINFSQKIKRFDLSFVNRFEYRAFKILENYFRHKQSFKVDFPELTSWGMRFYTAEESFFKFNGQGTHLVRLYGGLSALEGEYLQIKVYYALEKNKLAETWLTSDILGLNLNFTL